MKNLPSIYGERLRICTQSRVKPEEYYDTFTEEIKAIIKQKSKGRPIHPKGKEPSPTKVHDIMSLLQASLETQKKPSSKKFQKKKNQKKTA